MAVVGLIAMVAGLAILNLKELSGTDMPDRPEVFNKNFVSKVKILSSDKNEFSKNNNEY